MKAFLLLFLFSISSIPFLAGQSYLNVRYNLGFQDMGTTIVKTDSGFFVGAAEAEQGGVQWNVRIAKISDYGNILSNTTYGGNSNNYYIYPGSFIKIPNNLFAIAGGILDSVGLKGYLMKLNGNGDSLWTKVYSGNGNIQFYDCKSTTDGGFIMAGITYVYDTNGDALLMKVDSIGNVLWENHYGGASYQDAKSVIQTTDGGYLFVGKTKINAFDNDALIVKTNNVGIQQWSKNYGGSFQDALESCLQSVSDSTVLAVGIQSFYSPGPGTNYNKPLLIKINLLGDTIWTKTFGDSLYSQNINSISQTFQGEFVACGNRPDSITGSQNGLIINFDTNGNIKWINEYKNISGPSSNNLLKEIQILSSSEILAVGNVYPNLPDTGNVDSWVLRLDSLGCLIQNCTGVGLDEIITDIKISVAPNPNDGNFTIYYQLPTGQFGKFQLTDLNGGIIMELDLSSSESVLQIILHNSIPNGIYNVSLRTEKFQANIKTAIFR